MRYSIKKLLRSVAPLAALVLAFGTTTDAYAQIGSCTAAIAEVNLDVNNVRAAIFANGNLFWRGGNAIYEVPKGGGVQAIFTSGIWIGGTVGGQLRTAAARYGNYEFWAGPIDDSGNPPADCSEYDKIWKVNRADVTNFEAGGAAVPDLTNWPTGLGAPTLTPADGDGIDNDDDGDVDEPGEMRSITAEVLAQPLSQRINRVVDLAGGERPDILGDQTLWWIMNDRGNSHNGTGTPPIGLEVHGTAFAFNQAGDIGNTTFYKVNLFHKGNDALENTYLSIFSDPDLGNAFDDYVGSDTLLGMGFVYNADNDDESAGGYGPNPPAAGYDFFQGPIVASPGDTAHVSGRDVPDFKNLIMTSFIYYNNGGGINEDPGTGEDYYNYMQARWKDGRPILFGGDGFETNVTTEPTNFMYPGDPVTKEYWTEFNSDGAGAVNTPADRRFAMTTGPFTIEPGDQQEIVYGLVWARGADNLDSVAKLKNADKRAQAAFDANFKLPFPPDPPMVTVDEVDGQVILSWDNSPTGNNFLDSYVEFNPLGTPEDPFYRFEGYEIYQFESLQDQQGSMIATFDFNNGVTDILDDPDEDGITELTARGNDGGVRHSHTISGLTNYTDYYFGIRAYAYEVGSIPKSFTSPFTRVTVTPTRSGDVLSEDALAAAADLSEPDLVGVLTGIGDGSVSADVVNPAAVVDANYRVDFYPYGDDGGVQNTSVANREEEEGVVDADFSPKSVAKTAEHELTYDIYRNDVKVFDGSAGTAPAPKRANVLVIDGLEVSMEDSEPGFKNFLAVQNAAGPIDPPDYAAFAFNNWGYPHPTTGDRPTSAQQTNGSTWGFTAGGGTEGPWATWLSRVVRNDNLDRVSIYDYEMRFTAAGGLAYRRFNDGALVDVPFELWRTGISTPDDPSDDVRLIPGICEWACIGGDLATYEATGRQELAYDIGGDHGTSGGVNDPYTDWIYWGEPDDMTPGQSGYESFMFADGTWAGEVLARTVLVNWNGGAFPGPYDADMVETGTVLRIVTNKPIQSGDSFAFSTSGLGSSEASADLKKERLDEIGIVPNPYKGASAYEVSQLTDQVRFTNMPDEATIRIYSLNGTLLRTLEKNSPGEPSLAWDLTSDTRLPIASGMYLVHVEVPGVGSKIIKFGFVKKRTQLNTF